MQNGGAFNRKAPPFFVTVSRESRETNSKDFKVINDFNNLEPKSHVVRAGSMTRLRSSFLAARKKAEQLILNFEF